MECQIACMLNWSNVAKYLWLVPLIAYQQEAHAWGLVTHLYFADSLLWSMPLLDPRLQAIIKKFPQLVMAGACLPDLAVVSQKFHGNHHWQHIPQMLNTIDSEKETAIAIGYISHLYVDVIAHNHFVPAHEAMFAHESIITHIAVEWAMDAKLSPLMKSKPSQLLQQHHNELLNFCVKHFHVDTPNCRRAIKQLAFWDKVLRVVQLPQMIYLGMRLFNRNVKQNFIYYIAKTQTALDQFGSIFSGQQPAWQPELASQHASMSEWRLICLEHLKHHHPVPIDYFVKPNIKKTST